MPIDTVDREHFTGGKTEGGITSSYATDDGVKLKVAYSFMGSIYDDAERNAALEAMAQDTLTMGPKTQEFQNKFAKIHNVRHAFACSNCTTAMHVATQIFDIGPGDEVIVTPNTFVATSLAILKEGGIPVFADIDPRTFNIDPAEVAKKVTNRTRAIYVVHYAGLMVDMDPIMRLAEKHGLFVMEDAAHGMGGVYKGRKLGAIGHFGGFSLHEVKNINSLGEGGLLLTSEDFAGKQLAGARFLGLDFTRKIKDWLYDISPLTDRFGNIQIAGNHSSTEVQALGMLLQMRRLDAIIARRREAAEYMNKVLAEEDGILVEKPDTPDTYGTHHLYLLRIDPEKVGGDIQTLSGKLAEKGLTNITHFGPMYRFRIMKELGYDENAIAETCPNTERMFYHSYTHLPLYPLTRQQLEYQAAAVVEAVREMKAGK